MKKLNLSIVLLFAMLLQLVMVPDVSIAQTTDPVVLFRVNNGGPEIAAADGSSPVWSEDQVTGGTGGTAQTGTPSPYVNSDEIDPHAYGVEETITLDSSVPAAAPMELFQLERWADATGTQMQWDFPIPEGTQVEVRLYLAEIFDGIDGAGQRVFDVSIEGTVPAEFVGLDPYALGEGLYSGTMVSTTTTVTDGDNLDIDFIPDTENPAVKGIEIIQLPEPTVTITSPTDGEVFFTDTVNVSWESSDLTDEVHHAHLYIDTEDYAERIPNLPLDHTYEITGLAPGAHFVIVKLANELHIEIEGAEDRVDFTVVDLDAAEALIEVNPGAGLFASTFDSGSFQIHNTGEVDIESVTFDLRTAWMMDVVFDPLGTAGDAGAKCLTPDSGATATGFVEPGNLCTDPFSEPHNGVDSEDGYDVLTVNFTDFNPGESFTFSVDLDPTSIKDATDTGDAGAISGFEIIGASVSVGFSGEVVIDSNLYDEGSLGGSAALLTPIEAPAPVIAMQDVVPPTTLSEASQTVLITGTPGANFSILQPVARLYIDEVTPGYDIDPYESNEALAKSLYSGTFDSSGEASVPVTLFIEASPDAGPDAPLNHFIAVEVNIDGDFGLTSNSFVVEYEPEEPEPQEEICINAGGGDYTSVDGLFFMADTYFTATTGGTYSVTEPIDNTEDDELFQTERYGDPFSYTIPVDNGDYTVDLMFAELYHGVADAGGEGVPGDRIFSVDLEGDIVLSEYDIIAETGAPLTAITETFNTTVTDGEINLEFYLGENGVDNAKVSAICVTLANEPPTADAGEDQTVTDTDEDGFEEVTLDGSGSLDTDGEIVSWEWSWDSETATGEIATVTLPVGTHEIMLTVTDDDGDEGTDTVTITVNVPPIADAGMDQTVTDTDEDGFEDVTLDGSGSFDSDGDIVSWEWSWDSESAAGETNTVTLPVGTHEITLTVTDDDGAMDTDTVTIIVEPVEEEPTFVYYFPIFFNNSD